MGASCGLWRHHDKGASTNEGLSTLSPFYAFGADTGLIDWAILSLSSDEERSRSPTS
jgi:hypothetical protein